MAQALYQATLEITEEGVEMQLENQRTHAKSKYAAEVVRPRILFEMSPDGRPFPCPAVLECGCQENKPHFIYGGTYHETQLH